MTDYLREDERSNESYDSFDAYVDTLKDRLAEARRVLAGLEWCVEIDDVTTCPCCGTWMGKPGWETYKKHGYDCALAAALEGVNHD